MKGLRTRAKASAQSRLTTGDTMMFSLIIELAKNTEVRPYMIRKRLGFVAIVVAKNRPTGTKKTPSPKL